MTANTEFEWSHFSEQVNAANEKSIKYSVFLYKNSLEEVSHYCDNKHFYRKQHYICFKYNGKSMEIVNLHFKARKSKTTDGDVRQKIKNDEEQDHLQMLFKDKFEYFIAIW